MLRYCVISSTSERESWNIWIAGMDQWERWNSAIDQSEARKPFAGCYQAAGFRVGNVIFWNVFFNDLRIYLDRSMILWLNVLEWFKNLFQGEYDFVIKDLSAASYVFLGDWYLLLDFILVLFLVKKYSFLSATKSIVKLPTPENPWPILFYVLHCFIWASSCGASLGMGSVNLNPTKMRKKYQACTFCHKYLQKKA